MNHKGLSTKEAQDLLQKYGPNKLKEEKKKSVFALFFEQLWNIPNLVLTIAIILTIIVGDYPEAGIVAFIMLANAVIGVVQTENAQKALDALKKMSMTKATVIRDGEKKEISSEDLVPGDIVFLEAGKQVPADLKLIETVNFKVDEKLLSGESITVEKDANSEENDTEQTQKNHAYMSTIVTYGRATGQVVKTGVNTKVGQIANMVSQQAEQASPLQIAMNELSKTLSVIAVIICAIMFGVGTIQQRNIMDLLITAVSLAVAAIPEGLPMIVTVVMAIGMTKMAKSNAIVKNLNAVETLGAVGIVCSDKTGTLTQNKMTVVRTFFNSNFDYTSENHTDVEEHFLNGFVLCNDASIASDGSEIGDPTETALVMMGIKHNIDKNQLEQDFPRINEFAFDSDRKLMTTVHKTDNGCISYTKGSTDELLKRCKYIFENDVVREITDVDIQNIENAMYQMSEDALRVLSLAMRYDNDNAVEEDLIYIGMVGMIDPAREEVIESVRVFKQAGIKTVMITGDHKDTAFAIASKLGIAKDKSECIMGHELDVMSDEELKNRANNLSVFARVSPEHKVRIVKAFQDNGNIVSMTGKKHCPVMQ